MLITHNHIKHDNNKRGCSAGRSCFQFMGLLLQSFCPWHFLRDCSRATRIVLPVLFLLLWHFEKFFLNGKLNIMPLCHLFLVHNPWIHCFNLIPPVLQRDLFSFYGKTNSVGHSFVTVFTSYLIKFALNLWAFTLTGSVVWLQGLDSQVLPASCTMDAEDALFGVTSHPRDSANSGHTVGEFVFLGDAGVTGVLLGLSVTCCHLKAENMAAISTLQDVVYEQVQSMKQSHTCLPHKVKKNALKRKCQ